MVRLHGRRWQVDVREADGTRLRPSFATEEDAMAWEDAARWAIEIGKPLPETRTVHRTGSGTRDLALMGKVFDHVVRTEWEGMRAADALIRNGKQVVEYFGRNKRLEEITSADIADMKIAFAERGLAPSSVNKRVAALSKLFKVAKEAGAVDNRPTMKWNQVAKTRFRYLDQREEAVLLAFWKGQSWDDEHDMTLFMIDSGARCFSEAMPVRWDAFGARFGSVTFWHTKTNRPRTVPLTKRLREMFAERKKLMPGSVGPFAHMNKNTSVSRWRTMREALPSFADVTPHVMRHTCCTRLVLGGVDVKRVMEWMGHSAIVTTMRYMQIKPTGLQDVLHVLEGRDYAAD